MFILAFKVFLLAIFLFNIFIKSFAFYRCLAILFDCSLFSYVNAAKHLFYENWYFIEYFLNCSSRVYLDDICTFCNSYCRSFSYITFKKFFNRFLLKKFSLDFSSAFPFTQLSLLIITRERTKAALLENSNLVRLNSLFRGK